MHKKHQECINGRPTQRQRQKLSSGRRQIFTISENKPTDIPFYFVLLQSRAVPEAVWGHLFRGSKGESSPKILFLRFRTVPENRRERGGASTRVQIGEPFAVPPTWDTKGQYWPRCETCNEACGGRKEMGGGGIQSELTICQITCNAKGVIPLCNISRPGECGTHGKPPTKSYLLYRDMHFLGFNVARVPMLGFIIYSISLVL